MINKELTKSINLKLKEMEELRKLKNYNKQQDDFLNVAQDIINRTIDLCIKVVAK